ncbi:MAG: polysaccharide pyruvyl transferase family protein [Methylophilaceae bacterium]|nr:polysaccharide pyruvyl transferase family protein [Methylophilaceae bacterium]
MPKAIIVVGGEVLTCSVSDALPCDTDAIRNNVLYKIDSINRKNIDRLICRHTGSLAYVPDFKMLQGSESCQIPLAINSVGGSSLDPASQNFFSSLQAVEQAQYISVRDSVTHKLINEFNHELPSADLNPDIVSTLKICYAREVEIAFTSAISIYSWLLKPYLLFQVNDDYFRKNDLHRVGEVLANTATTLNLNLVFQPAGIAPGHDSFAMLDQLAQIARKYMDKSKHIHTQLDRNVWTQVGFIANAACFVGTSLHGRIVATAFSRPRVGLENSKVNAYVSTWEELNFQPFDVPIEELLASVKKAMSISSAIMDLYADHQAKLALLGFTSLRKKLNLSEFDGDVNFVKEQIHHITELALLQESEALRDAVIDLGYELSLEQAKKKLPQNKMLKFFKWQKTKASCALAWIVTKARASGIF